MNNQEQLKNLITGSNLSAEDQNLWNSFIEGMDNETAESLVGIFQAYPNEIGWFSENLKKKKEAFGVMEVNPEQGKAMFNEIFEQEKQKLEELAQKQGE